MNKTVTPAIVLRRQGFLEADRKVSFLTLSHGKVTAFVKGVRWAKGRLGSLVEPFSEAEVHLQIRQAKGLATLIGGTLRRSHPFLRGRLPAWTTACYLCELTDALSPELVPHPDVFKLLSEALQALEQTKNPTLIRLGYTLQFLQDVGYGLSEELKSWDLPPEERRFYQLIAVSPVERWTEFPVELSDPAERFDKRLKRFLDDHLPRPLLSAGFENTLAAAAATARP